MTAAAQKRALRWAKLLFFLVLPPLVFFNLDTVLGWCGAAKVTPEAYKAAAGYLKLVLFFHIFSH